MSELQKSMPALYSNVPVFKNNIQTFKKYGGLKIIQWNLSIADTAPAREHFFQERIGFI